MIRTNFDIVLDSKIESINFAMIKIGNIPWEISTRDVIQLIEPFLWKRQASQDWVHIPIDRVTGKTLSDLFVEIPTAYEAQIICSNLDKSLLKQRALNVSMSEHDELMAVLIGPEAALSKRFILADEVESLLDICLNYKVKQKFYLNNHFNNCLDSFLQEMC